MRLAFILVLVCATAHAAEPVRVEPFENRCFDVSQLVALLEARGLSVATAARTGKLGQEVQVTSTAESIDVRIVAHDAQGHLVGVEDRRLPSGPCETLLETAALIILRAATPLHFMPDEPKPRPRRQPPVVAAPSVQPEPAPEEPLPVEPVAPVRALQMPVLSRPADATPAVVLRPTVHRRPVVELELRGLWLFPVDGVPSAVAGDVGVQVRWSRRLGLAVRGGVANHFRAADHSGDSAAMLEVRRVPLSLLLEVELGLPKGAIRVGAGALVNVWRVDSSGVSQAATTWTAQPAIELDVAYRYTVRRFFAEAGLGVGIALLRQDLVITGAGTLSHTPVVDLDPFLGMGVSL